MGGLGVIVEYSSLSQEEESVKDKLSCSGIYMSNGWVLTHATIVIDLLKSKEAHLLIEQLKTKGFASFNASNKSPLQTVLDNTKSKFQIIFEEKNYKDVFPCELSSYMMSRGKESEVSTLVSSKPLQLLQDLSHISREGKSQLHLPLASSSSAETPSYFCHPAELFMVFSEPGIAQSLSDMMPAAQGWRLTEDTEGEESYQDLESITVSSFALLKVIPFKTNIDKAMSETYDEEELINLIEKIIPITEVASKGTSVYVESSPFGSLSPSVFLNSLSKGIISNVGGSEKNVYLTDARCVMGAEGAPVYAAINGKLSLCGMIISPFCWKRGEWLGLSLVAAARPVLFSLLRSLMYKSNEGGGSIKPAKKKEFSAIDPVSRSKGFYGDDKDEVPKNIMANLTFEDIAKTLDSVVVGICCGGGWGSGIVINSSPGVILTCAHVIQPAKSGEVAVITSDGTRISGQVIYHTHPYCFVEEGTINNAKQGESMWDIAVVLTSTSLPYALPLAAHLPHKGSPVIVAGHGIFSPNRLPSPTLSHGVISKIVSIDISNLSYSAADVDEQKVDSLSKDGIHVDSKTYDNAHRLQERHEETCYRMSEVMLKLTSNDDCDKSDEVEELHDANGRVLFGCDENGLVPVMLQTTCSVYAGNSGGPVVIYHPQHGLQVAGVMVCNTRDLANKATFPHVNLAVPAPAINKIITAYLSSGNKMLLNYLGVQCATVSKLWALGLTPQSHL